MFTRKGKNLERRVHYAENVSAKKLHRKKEHGSVKECLTETVARYLHAAGQKAERVFPIDDA